MAEKDKPADIVVIIEAKNEENLLTLEAFDEMIDLHKFILEIAV